MFKESLVTAARGWVHYRSGPARAWTVRLLAVCNHELTYETNSSSAAPQRGTKRPMFEIRFVAPRLYQGASKIAHAGTRTGSQAWEA